MSPTCDPSVSKVHRRVEVGIIETRTEVGGTGDQMVDINHNSYGCGWITNPKVLLPHFHRFHKSWYGLDISYDAFKVKNNKMIIVILSLLYLKPKRVRFQI